MQGMNSITGHLGPIPPNLCKMEVEMSEMVMDLSNVHHKMLVCPQSGALLKTRRKSMPTRRR